MNALLENPDTIVPSGEDAKLAAESSRILASKRPEEDLHLHLDDGQMLTLPKAADIGAEDVPVAGGYGMERTGRAWRFS